MPHSCALCGLVCAHDIPVVEVAALRATIETCCVPTAHVFRAIACRKQRSCRLCVACNDWASRMAKCRPQSKQYIPMDGMLLYLANPCAMRAPDVRNVRRLLHALTHTVAGFSNAYAHDTTVRDVLSLVRVSRYRKDIERITDAWWQLNGCCEVFASAGISSSVRRLQRHAPY